MKIVGNWIKKYTEGEFVCISEGAWARGARVDFERFMKIASGSVEPSKTEQQRIYDYFRSRDDLPKVEFEAIFPSQKSLKQAEEERVKAIDAQRGRTIEQIQAENRKLREIQNQRREARRQAILAAQRNRIEQEQNNFRTPVRRKT